MRTFVAVLGFLSVLDVPLGAQVTIAPRAVEPAAWERFALQVANQQAAPVIHVRLEVPEALTILGTEAPPGWSFRVLAAADTTPQAIEWSRGALERGAFEEFAFLGRLVGDARRRDLVFPVRLLRSDGSELRRDGTSGAAPAPTVTIRGTTFITSWGAAALGGAALGVSLLALAIAVFGRRASGAGSGPGS